MKAIQLLRVKADDLRISGKVQTEKIALSSLQTVLHDDVVANIDVLSNVPFVYRKDNELYAFTQMLILLDDKKRPYQLPEYFYVIEMQGTTKEIVNAAQNYCLGILAIQCTRSSLYPFAYATFAFYPWNPEIITWHTGIKSEAGMAKAMRCCRSTIRTMKANWRASKCVTLFVN
ncbi:hypothetical protein [Paraglaciecola aestuariivivens]